MERKTNGKKERQKEREIERKRDRNREIVRKKYRQKIIRLEKQEVERKKDVVITAPSS